MKDKAFTPLRAKIHNVPDAGDAARVREYAKKSGKSARAAEYEQLAAAIDALYASRGGSESALALAPRIQLPALAKALRVHGATLGTTTDPAERLALSARLLGLLRKHFPKIGDPETALAALDASLDLETDVYTAGNTLLAGDERRSRRVLLELLDQTAEALYGTGFIGVRELGGIKSSRARIARGSSPVLNAYRQELRYLARAPEWSSRWLEFNFGQTVTHMAPLEPEVHLYPQDRLRGSPLLFYGAIVDGLVLDANQLAGIEHELFGKAIGTGLRALNPGLTRGVLLATDGSEEAGDIRNDGIYLLPETTAELPPVAGILTLGEGSSLSHVQLLARNLGIPNVVVGESVLPQVRARIGSPAVLAVSPNGVVKLVADGPKWNEIFGDDEADEPSGIVIRPDLEKLDVRTTSLLPLSELRATDSGRTSGPKGANLGELRHFFGDAVPNGFVIPFGAFRALLDQPIEPGGPPVFEWMKERYAAIERAKKNPAAQRRIVAAFLPRLRSWIENADPGPEFRRQLKASLDASFGRDGSYGVFLRSDTNVEDLAGFTGAGLNLTVGNVVGSDAILAAIHRVWASPFTERSFEWRQSLMEDPEYVFPAVVVQLGFAAEKSGVMVTADIENGEPGWITVAVNEGVGGAVEGQATESLRIKESSGEVRFLARATAPEKAVLEPGGGIGHQPTSGTGEILKKGEIDQLIAFARDARERFTELRDEDGKVMPADVEFAFKNGRLALLQIRPFVESRRAQGNLFLSGLDASFRERGSVRVPLDSVPTTRHRRASL